MPVELTVFAAASLNAPFTEIGRMFEVDHPELVVIFNFAGSQQLARQINEGAPVDIFAAADHQPMDSLVAAGSITAAASRGFARNRLAAIYPLQNPAGLDEWADLSNSGLKLVIAAAEVPVGGYTLEFLDKAAADPAYGPAFKAGVLQNVVSYEDNVSAVLTKVILGEADAGVVYVSDISGENAAKVGRLDIPEAFNVIAVYPIAPIRDSRNPEAAQAFIDLVLSPAGQAVLGDYGFLPVIQ